MFYVSEKLNIKYLLFLHKKNISFLNIFYIKYTDILILIYESIHLDSFNKLKDLNNNLKEINKKNYIHFIKNDLIENKIVYSNEKL